MIDWFGASWRDLFSIWKKTFVCSVYIPPKHSKRKGSENDFDPYSELRNDISKYAALGRIILMGDFNARKGSLDDTVGPCNLPFSDLEDESLNTDADVSFPKCVSRDMTINTYGRALTNMCITNKLCFLNGRTRSDRLGNFTCFTCNSASVVDYAIVGHDVLENIIYFTVHPLTLLSNHCYISFALKTTTFTTDNSRDNFLSDSLQRFKWNEMSKDMFRNTLNGSEIFTSTEQLINEFCDLKHAPEQINVDEMISSTNSIIIRIAKSCLTQKQIKRKGRSSLNKGAFKKRKKWYDYSCSEARKIFRSAAKSLSRYPKDPVVRGKYIKCKKQYKTLVKEKKNSVS